MLGKDGGLAIDLEQQHGVGITAIPLLHAGRADGHARDGDTLGRRLLGQRTVDVRGRDMAFDQVTVDHAGVAGREGYGYRVFRRDFFAFDKALRVARYRPYPFLNCAASSEPPVASPALRNEHLPRPVSLCR